MILSLDFRGETHRRPKTGYRATRLPAGTDLARFKKGVPHATSLSEELAHVLPFGMQ